MKIRQRSKSSSTEEASSTTTTSAEPPSIEAHPDLVMLIESGDTLSGAAAEVTGDWQDWQPLHELNRAKVPNPDAIDPGDELDFPQSWRPRDARPRRLAAARLLRLGAAHAPPSCSRSRSCSALSAARPNASSVRGPRRRSRPRIAPAIASRPDATGASTPAQRATDARKARPITVSSVM